MRLFVKEQGSGPVVLFLHGFCDTHDLWRDFVPAFTGDCHVIAPDLPGFGKSDLLPAPFSIAQVADAVGTELRNRANGRVIIVGHSLGGYVALAMVKKMAKQLAGLILFHSTPFPDSAERKEVRNKVIESVRTYGVEPFVRTFVPGLFADKLNAELPIMMERAMQTSAEAISGYAAAMRDRPDLSSWFSGAGIPMVVIAGEQDALIPLQPLIAWSGKVPNCDVHILPNVGHLGIFEAKNECQGIILRFIQEVNNRP